MRPKTSLWNLVVAMCLLAYQGCGPAQEPTSEAVAGKSKSEVIAMYGEPDSIAHADTTYPGPNWSEEKIEEWNQTTVFRALVYGDIVVDLNKYDRVVGVHRVKWVEGSPSK